MTPTFILIHQPCFSYYDWYLPKTKAMEPPRDIRLPPELWCWVLSNVDDLTLWTGCRRVNKLFRAEAEREFATHRLKYLKITCFARSFRRYLSVPVYHNVEAATNTLVSVDGDRATFLLNTFRQCIRAHTLPNPVMNVAYEVPSIYGFIHRNLSNSDRNVSARLGWGSEWGQTCNLGDYQLDAPLPNLDLDCRVAEAEQSKTRISFDWKPLLDGLLSVFAQSRRQAQLKGYADLDAEVMRAHLWAKYNGVKSIPKLEYFTWKMRYGSAQSRNCFQDAYAQRITRFLKRKHLHFEPNLDRNDYNLDEEAWGELEEYIDDCIEKRNELVIKNFMSENNIALG